MTRFLIPLLVSIAASGPLSANRQTPFRSSADGVYVDVSVRDGRRPVAGLTDRDFQIWDNGVSQHVDAAEVATIGINLTVVMDLSGSASPYAPWLLGGVRDVRDMLSDADRPELITVGRHIRLSTAPLEDALKLSPPLIGDGGSHLFDAITAACMKETEVGRRHLVVVFTDGLDTRSAIPSAIRQDVLRHSNAVVEVFAISTRGRTSSVYTQYGTPGSPSRDPLSARDYGSAPTQAPRREAVGDFDHVLTDITDASAGRFHDMRSGDSPAEALGRTLELFRHHYILRFRPSGVTSGGWHTLRVSVAQGSYEVIARKGYEGSK